MFFRDLNVGEVLGWDIADMAESVTIHAFVHAPFDTYVHDQTRFWNASGLSVKLASTGVEVQVESLRALLLGGIAFETPPATRPGEASAEKHVFPLFANQNLANGASYSRKIPMVAYFPGSVSGLASGSEVTMHGLVVGQVTDVRLAYDATKESVLAPVRFEVEPERVLGIGKRAFDTPAEGVDQLVKQGLRATLHTASLITGQQVVALDFVSNPPPATVTMAGEDFVLPTTDSGGLGDLGTSVTGLISKVSTIPFDQIGKNLDDILQAVNDFANGAQLRQSLTDLGGAIKSADNVIQHLDSDMNPALRIAAGDSC